MIMTHYLMIMILIKVYNYSDIVLKLYKNPASPTDLPSFFWDPEWLTF